MTQEHTGGVVRAIVERLNATTEKALHALDPGSIRGEDVLRRVLVTLPGMVYRCRLDLDRTIEFASLGARNLTGFDPVDLVENRVVSYTRLIHGDDIARVREAVLRAVDSGSPFEVTYRIRRVDGRELWVKELGCAARGASGEIEAIEGLVTALTREDLRDVVHDLNNVLATIKTTAELALLEAQDPSLVADLTEIVSAASRGAALARNLLPPPTPPPAE